MLLSRSHSSFPYHADPDVMQSYASQYPAMLSCNKHFQFSFHKLSVKEKIMFPLLGDFMPLMTLLMGKCPVTVFSKAVNENSEKAPTWTKT